MKLRSKSKQSYVDMPVVSEKEMVVRGVLFDVLYDVFKVLLEKDNGENSYAEMKKSSFNMISKLQEQNETIAVNKKISQPNALYAETFCDKEPEIAEKDNYTKFDVGSLHMGSILVKRILKSTIKAPALPSPD